MYKKWYQSMLRVSSFNRCQASIIVSSKSCVKPKRAFLYSRILVVEQYSARNALLSSSKEVIEFAGMYNDPLLALSLSILGKRLIFVTSAELSSFIPSQHDENSARCSRGLSAAVPPNYNLFFINFSTLGFKLIR